MPAATSSPAARTEKEEQLWIALKRHIMRERQRKKEEQEAEVEEERLRKEREAREKQDEMTLGETRDQIQLYGNKLEELKNEKKQLFLKLKKVLNEDDNRKRQLHKESNEMFGIQNLPTQANAPQPQFFLPPRVPPHQQHIQKSTLGQGVGNNQTLKRGRSPSPPQGLYKSGNQQYSQITKHEEGRRGGEPNRAVLWNKPTQYTNSPGTLFYPNAPANPPDTRPHPILFSAYSSINIPIRQNYLPEMNQSNQAQTKTEKAPQPGTVYHINLDPPNPTVQQSPQQTTQIIPQSSHKGQVSMEKITDRSGYHIEIKHDDRKDVRASQPSQSHIPEGLVYTTPLRHIPMHSGVIPQSSPQANKGGSITQGYAGRPPANPQQIQQQPQTQIHYPRHHYQ